MIRVELDRILTDAVAERGCYRAALPALVRLLGYADHRLGNCLNPEAAAELAMEIDRALNAAVGRAAVRH